MIPIPLGPTPPVLRDHIKTRSKTSGPSKRKEPAKRKSPLEIKQNLKRPKLDNNNNSIDLVEIRLDTDQRGDAVMLPQPYITKPMAENVFVFVDMKQGKLYDNDCGCGDWLVDNENDPELQVVDFPSSINVQRNRSMDIVNRVKFLIRKGHTAKAFLRTRYETKWNGQKSTHHDFFLAFGQTEVVDQVRALEWTHERERQRQRREHIRHVLSNIDSATMDRLVARLSEPKRREWIGFLKCKTRELFKEFIEKNLDACTNVSFSDKY